MTSRPHAKAALGRRRVFVAALLLTAVAGGLRLGVMEEIFPPKLLGDEMYYVVVAANIAAGRGHVYGANARALRPPAHAWLLAQFADADALLWQTARGRPRLAVRVDRLRPLLRVEVVLGTALVLATAWLAWALFDTHTAFVAGALASVYPTFVAYSHFLWSETLFAVLVTAALAAFVTGERRRSAVLAAFAGLLFGAAALTREIALPVAAGAGAWALLAAPAEERRRAARRGILMLACAAAVVLPWVLRNQAQLGRILPISSVGWLAVGEGNALDGSQWLRPASPGRTEFRRDVLAIDGEVARMEHARRRTLEMIASDQPAWIFRKLVHNLPLMLSPDAFQLYKLRNASYGEVSPGVESWITAVTVVAYFVVMGLAAFGIAGAPGDHRRLLALLVLGVVLGVHVVANANSRFRMPWMPLLMAYAAHAVVGGRGLLSALTARERLSAIAAASAVAGICVSYFWVGWS